MTPDVSNFLLIPDLIASGCAAWCPSWFCMLLNHDNFLLARVMFAKVVRGLTQLLPAGFKLLNPLTPIIAF